MLLKLKTYNYDVVIVYENFKGSTLQTNPILAELIRRPDAQRRKHFVVLLSQRIATNDAMSAFVHSVDQVINITDLANFKPVLRRGVISAPRALQLFQRDAQERAVALISYKRRMTLMSRVCAAIHKIIFFTRRCRGYQSILRVTYITTPADEERNRAHQQRVILLSQSDVKKRVNTRQTGAYHQCPSAAAEEEPAIPRDQDRRCGCSDQISQTEADEFRNGEEQQIKQAKRSADHQVLERMDFLPRSDFEQEKRRENKTKKSTPYLIERSTKR